MLTQKSIILLNKYTYIYYVIIVEDTSILLSTGDFETVWLYREFGQCARAPRPLGGVLLMHHV